jgi:peroxiredoxin
MSLIYAKELPLGNKMENFELEDAFGQRYSVEEVLGEIGIIIAVMCNHCPYSNAIWKRLERVSEFAKKLDITTLAINPNIHPNFPEDSPAHMRDKIEEFSLTFPYLVDEEQKVAKALGAVCTPDIFLFNKNKELFYHGRLDDNWHDEKSVKYEDLREAVISLFGGQEPPKKQFPSQGCSIKWIDTVIG